MVIRARHPNNKHRESLRRCARVSGMSRIPASGKLRSSPAEAGKGAVVDMLIVTIELPLPAETCAGLKLHEVKAGKPEHEMLTLLGKLPVFGFTVTLNSALFPRPTATLPG